MRSFVDIEIEKLASPDIIEQVSFDAILVEMKTQLNSLQPLLFDHSQAPKLIEAELITADNGEQYFKVPKTNDAGLLYLELESEPLVKLLEIAAYREGLQRQRINEAAKALMLAYAKDKDLDHLGANKNIKRLTITPAQPDALPPVPTQMETNESFRRRIQLAPEGYSTAGSTGSYVFHGLSASPLVKAIDVIAPTFTAAALSAEQQAVLPANVIVLQIIDDAGLNDPLPGDVAAIILSNEGNGSASSELIAEVGAALNADEIRPVTDRCIVRSAEIINYQVTAELILFNGPDANVVLAAAEKALNEYIKKSQTIGVAPTHAGFYRALKQPGVYDVILSLPAAPVILSAYQSAHCTAANITIGANNG